ncbi:MAG: hypothetical protein C4531_11100 [Desulfurivibrio sp.]|nr:MAG: hypothetical protein C4531_11100 [Desulfurivibrio sp.]
MKKHPFLIPLLLAALFFCSMSDAYEGLCPSPRADSMQLGVAAGLTDQQQAAADQPAMDTIFHLPLLGRQDARDYSLPALAVILGLLDGFNPCAMWVLVYLISLIMGLNDRRKIWLLVGSFLLASGVLYFLFLTAWLNAFLFIGYLRPLTLLIGLFALWTGTGNLREYVVTRGAVACKVTDDKAKKKTMDRIRQLVSSPLTMASIFGIMVLAFAVNSIEFLCSAGIPAIFTHVLAISDADVMQYYACILLYVFCFMLDDLLIFSSAVLAVNSSCGEKYAGLCKALGGIIMIVLGVLLTFFPDMLR